MKTIKQEKMSALMVKGGFTLMADGDVIHEFYEAKMHEDGFYRCANGELTKSKKLAVREKRFVKLKLDGHGWPKTATAIDALREMRLAFKELNEWTKSMGTK